ncbi:MAG: leucine-rich repeat domain-containing protein [Bdellovibrionales bacterium]|nr:leucine-rich repeat domain-containing protein [Bdellovibrionales bacterium]
MKDKLKTFKIRIFVVLFLWSVGCEREPFDKGKGNEGQSPLVCSFPNSLKKAVSTSLKKECENSTLKDLHFIKSLRIEINKGEGGLLTKKYAPYFKSLEELDISNNPTLLSLPEFVSYLPHLKKLNISRTGIKSFPKEICQLKNSLTTLLATHNNYEDQEIPMEVFCLHKLKILDMSNSSLHYIDEYIGKLSHLEELYVSGNFLLIIPHMLPTLPRLVLVDFRNNYLKNEDLNSIQSCKSLEEGEREKCQEDLLGSITCEATHELPFQRGEPLRQMYTSLVAQHEKAIIEQCEQDSVFVYCPSFFTKCKEYPDYDKPQCMLDVFENPREEERHRPHRDRCYLTWIGWFVDYDKSPELLNKTIRGQTIRELRYVSRYMQENKNFYEYCFRPWWNPFKDVRIDAPFLRNWVDNAPQKYEPHPVEMFPKAFRYPGIASHVKAWFADGDEFHWVPENCPHLPNNLKEQIEKIANEEREE